MVKQQYDMATQSAFKPLSQVAGDTAGDNTWLSVRSLCVYVRVHAGYLSRGA